MSKCIICGKEMKKQIIEIDNSWGDKMKKETAEAYVCICGEKAFEGKEVRRLQRLAQKY